MIRYTNRKVVGGDKFGNMTTYLEYLEGFCNSTDEKPTVNVANGSNLIESDTGDWYFFNEDAGTWSKMRTIKE